jgi:hypothetical protein
VEEDRTSALGFSEKATLPELAGSWAGLAGSLAEQDVLIRVGIKRRIEITEVNVGWGNSSVTGSQPRLSPKKTRFMRGLLPRAVAIRQ